MKRLQRGHTKNRRLSMVYRQQAHTHGRLRNYAKAWHFYTKSLCYAPAGSRYMGLAYGYRSEMFGKFRQHDHELVDIDLAAKSACPRWLIAELHTNRLLCEKKLPSAEPSPAGVPDVQLDYQPHGRNAELAEVLSIDRSKEFGRFVVANADIDVGKVLIAETPFAIGASNEPSYQCQTCLKRQQNFVACTHCADVVFCDEACERRNRTHRFVCGTGFGRLKNWLKLNIETILVAMAIFADADQLESFVRTTCNTELLATYTTDMMDARAKYRCFLLLERSGDANVLVTAYETYQLMLEMPTIRAYFNTAPRQRFLAHLLCHHTGVNALNGFTMDDCAVVCAVTSLLNHSCTPNVITCLVDNRMVCRTIRTVRPGEQLFINYLHDFDWPQQRRHEIQEIWGFECRCGACVPAYDTAHMDWLERDRRYGEVCAAVANMPGCYGWPKDECRLYIGLCEDLLRDYGSMPWTPHLQVLLKFYTALRGST